MRYIKFWANMLLIPVYILVFIVMENWRLIPQLWHELTGAIKDTKRKYKIGQ